MQDRPEGVVSKSGIAGTIRAAIIIGSRRPVLNARRCRSLATRLVARSYLGRRKGKELIYAGKVDHGFTPASAKELQARLKPLIHTQRYSKRISHRGIWVEPEVLAEIEYRTKSAEGKVRHPFFKGLREDL